MKKKYYYAKWCDNGNTTIGNVSFYAISDHHAKMQADKIGRDIGLRKASRTIECEGRMVEMRGRQP